MREFDLIMLDGKDLKTYEWTDVENPIAILQLVHGSAEHILRYKKFAKVMNENGIIVVGDDHRGHGKTANLEENELGFFAKKNGWNKIIDDEKQVNNYIKKTWPNLPIFMLGHSMGSFMARTYAIKYSETISGVIFMGTAEHNNLTLWFGKTIAKIQQKFIGAKTPSKFIWKNSYKPLNKKFNSENSNGQEWLTSDTKIQQEFFSDPLTKQIFSTSAFKDMLGGISFNQKNKNIKLMREDLPILILSGEQDPVGHYGKDPLKLNKKLQDLNYNSNVKVYPNLRHEILNEPTKKEVENDIIDFIKNNLQ